MGLVNRYTHLLWAQQIKFKLHQKVRPLNKIPEMVLIVFSYSQGELGQTF